MHSKEVFVGYDFQSGKEGYGYPVVASEKFVLHSLDDPLVFLLLGVTQVTPRLKVFEGVEQRTSPGDS